jgi:hypothetical protein
MPDSRCLVPAFNGAIFSPEWRDALWDKFYTSAPQRLRQSGYQYMGPYFDAVNEPLNAAVELVVSPSRIFGHKAFGVCGRSSVVEHLLPKQMVYLPGFLIPDDKGMLNLRQIATPFSPKSTQAVCTHRSVTGPRHRPQSFQILPPLRA